MEQNNKLREEIEEVLKRYRLFLATEGMKKKATFSLLLSKDRDELLRDHDYLKECELFLKAGHRLSLPNLPDLDPILTDLDKGRALEVSSLLSIKDLLSSVREIQKELLSLENLEILVDESYLLKPIANLEQKLSQSIESDGTISDTATGKLFSLRGEIRSLESQIQGAMEVYRRRYSRYLSLDSVTIKAGMETLPVKLSDKGQVPGTVLSYSKTGETVYMVPYAVLEQKNKLLSLRQEEQEEILKILADLSSLARENLPSLAQDYEVLLRLDRFFGATDFGHSYDGSIATLSTDSLTLESFFHPLLNAETIVSNTLSMGGEKPRLLLITGPNAGGKSILIRAVGIAVLMDRLGLFVPAHQGGEVPFLKDVLFLGGDNQSVMDNLSTFSGHLLGIKGIIEKADKDSLVIIDEVGEGTSPKDGEALGIALLSYFEDLSSLTLMTSHFDGMKNYALSDKRVLSAAMEFKKETLSPTYRLLVGTSGNSYGLLLARRIGLPESILKRAEEYNRSRNEIDVDSIVDDLNAQKRRLEEKEKTIDNRLKDLERLETKKKQQLEAINLEKSNIHLRAQEKVERIVEKKIAELDLLFQGKGRKELSFNELSKAKGELHQFLEKDKKVEPEKQVPLPTLKEGDYVLDEDHHLGKVLELKKNEATIDYDGLKIRRPIAGLSLTTKKKEAKKTYVETVHLDLNPSQGMELNIIGLHVDEAMRKVVSFLDSGRVRKLSSVRIIHGAGTFALKNALWKYLQNHSDFVKDYRLGGEGEGGLGATIIHLK